MELWQPFDKGTRVYTITIDLLRYHKYIRVSYSTGTFEKFQSIPAWHFPTDAEYTADSLPLLMEETSSQISNTIEQLLSFQKSYLRPDNWKAFLRMILPNLDISEKDKSKIVKFAAAGVSEHVIQPVTLISSSAAVALAAFTCTEAYFKAPQVVPQGNLLVCHVSAGEMDVAIYHQGTDQTIRQHYAGKCDSVSVHNVYQQLQLRSKHEHVHLPSGRRASPSRTGPVFVFNVVYEQFLRSYNPDDDSHGDNDPVLIGYTGTSKSQLSFVKVSIPKKEVIDIFLSLWWKLHYALDQHAEEAARRGIQLGSVIVAGEVTQLPWIDSCLQIWGRAARARGHPSLNVVLCKFSDDGIPDGAVTCTVRALGTKIVQRSRKSFGYSPKPIQSVDPSLPVPKSDVIWKFYKHTEIEGPMFTPFPVHTHPRNRVEVANIAYVHLFELVSTTSYPPPQRAKWVDEKIFIKTTFTDDDVGRLSSTPTPLKEAHQCETEWCLTFTLWVPCGVIYVGTPYATPSQDDPDTKVGTSEIIFF